MQTKLFWARDTFSIASLHIILNAAGSIIFKGQMIIMVKKKYYNLPPQNTLFMEFVD